MRRSAPIAAVCTALALAGCSSDDEGTPEACLVPARDYVGALESAPEPVTLADGTPISACLPAAQDTAELADVGEAVIEAATALNDAARDDPGGADALRLGYLVGALQQGASETGGIHADLLRRLDASARYAAEGKRLPVGFERAFGEGYAAGQETG